MSIKKITQCCVLLIASQVSFAQVADSGSFFLHKFAQKIGKETYHIKRNGSKLTYDVDFKFVDRGSAVPLKAQLSTTANHEPLELIIKGSTSRFSTINDSVALSGNTAYIKIGDSLTMQKRMANEFPVAGYSPGTVQMVLLKYWKKHAEPKSIRMLPKGSVTISRQGKDTLMFMSKPLVLTRYVVGGLIWGNEIIWTDAKDNMVCLITNDAEGDKLEMMKEEYELLLPELINRAAASGMNLFSTSMKMERSSQKLLAIVGGNVVDVESGQTLSNTVIVVENGLIKEIGAAGSFPIPANAVIIHAEGKNILPGLWDMHAHFQQAEWGPAYLAAGVTTVRDCGNEFGYITAIKNAIDEHRGVGPFIIKAGIIDGPGENGLGIIRASTKEEAIKAVDDYKANGFAQIKIYSAVQPDMVKAISDQAHHLGLTVTGHIPGKMSLRAAIDSGMDQVNHIQFVYSMMKKRKDRSIDLEDSSNIAALDFLKAHQTVIDPTVGVFEMIFRPLNEDILQMEPNYYKLPLPLQAIFSSMGMEPDQAEKMKPMFQSMKTLVKALYDKGIPVIAGTDMGFPGYSLARELELYVEGGLTPMQAIQSATIVPAQVMKMDKNSGSIKAGKQADLIIIDGDPVTSIRSIRNVWMVIKEGEQYDPKALHKMVGFTE
jgi:imidazolonepropionase-like amidohydrolase